MLSCMYKFKIAKDINFAYNIVFDLHIKNNIILIPTKVSHRNEPALYRIILPDKHLEFMLSPSNRLLEIWHIDSYELYDFEIYYLENGEIIIETLRPSIQIIDKKNEDINLIRSKMVSAVVDMNFETNKVKQIIDHNDNKAIFDNNDNILFINGIEINDQRNYERI